MKNYFFWAGSVLIFALMAAELLRHEWMPTFDDAYMFIRYAINLYNGYGIAWNQDSVQTYGVTAFLYFLVVTAGYWFFPGSDGVLLISISTLFGVMSIVLLAVTLTRYGRDVPRLSFPFWLFYVLLFVSLTPHFLFHCRSGMDTTMAIFVNSLLIFTTLEIGKRSKQSDASLITLSFIAYLSISTRPDNVFYAALFPSLYLLLRTTGRSYRDIILFGCALFILLGIDLLIKQLIFGNPLPLPYYAKQSSYFSDYRGTDVWNPATYLRQFLYVVLPALIVVITFLEKKTAWLVFSFLLPVCLAFSYLLFTVLQIMGFYSRFYYPAFPFFIVLSGILVVKFVGKLPNRWSFKPLHWRLPALLLLGFLVSPLPSQLWQWARDISSGNVSSPVFETRAEEIAKKNRWRAAVSKMLTIVKNSPPDITYAMSEHGEIGAKAPEIRIIDLVGLHNLHFALNGFDPNYFFEQGVDFIWLPPHDYISLRDSIITDPRFQRDFLYKPEDLEFGVAVNKRGPHFKHLKLLLNRVE